MTIDEQRACMEPLQMAGQLIMENGGETFRVEETITRMGRAFGLCDVECFAVPSGVFISYRLTDGSTASSVKRVHRGDTNLTWVNEVNSISRRVEAEKLSHVDALAALRDIQARKVPAALMPWSAGLCAGGFAVMFRGGWKEFLIAFSVAALVQLLSMLLERLHMKNMVSVLLGSMLSTLIPMSIGAWWPVLIREAVIAGALMPMLPGLAMTNAVQDTLRGDMVSGLSHGIQALLTAALVAGGALISSTLFRMLAGGGMQ